MNNPSRIMESIMSHISLNLLIETERQKIENILKNTNLFDNSDDEDDNPNWRSTTVYAPRWSIMSQPRAKPEAALS